MKKKYLVLIIVFLIAIVFSSILFFSKKDATEEFKIDKQSTFYIISSKSIDSYKLNGESIEKLSNSSVKLPAIVNPGIQKGEFNNRYLVVSAGDNSDFTNDERIVSIDFQKGLIYQKSTPHYAYTGGGFSDKYFYSFQSTTEDGSLYQFDKLGNEKKSYIFDSSTTPGSQFLGKKGKLYLIGNQVSDQDESVYTSHLFTIDENNLRIIDNTLLDDNSEKIYGFTSLTVVDNILYSPITAMRDRITYENVGNNTFLAYNLETKEKEYCSLSEKFPNLIYASKTDDYLIFIHEPYSLGKSGLSLFNRKTKISEFINVGELLGNNDLDKNKIVSINTNKKNELFILTQSSLVIWDIEKDKLISKKNNISEKAFYIWVNE